MSNLVSLTALAESKKQISLAARVTVLASIFLPLSFCTSIFGMNFVKVEGLSIWVGALVTVLGGSGWWWCMRGMREGGGSEMVW